MSILDKGAETMGILQKLFGGLQKGGAIPIQHSQVDVRHSLSIIVSDTDTLRDNVGNPYSTYTAMVNELSKKYEGRADWGNQFAQNIINVRASFIIGSGIKPMELIEGSTREMEFIEDFIEHNALDFETPQDWAREAEIEGKILVTLNVDKKVEFAQRKRPAGMIEARFLPWSANKYTVNTNGEDYQEYINVVYTPPMSNTQKTLLANQFVYKRFGGRTHIVNDTTPRLGTILKQLEDLDKALWDWRRINHFFASPTPHFKCEDAMQAESLYNQLAEIKWNIGKLLVTTADYSMVGIDSGGIQSLENEIITLAKIISGATGVPVHFLGLPDLMSNRATAENLMELINSSTYKERLVWIGFYNELFRKALQMANDTLKMGFNVDAVGVDIPFVSANKMQELVDVWLPLYSANVISLDTLLSKIPEVDAEEEKAAVEQQKAEALERYMNQFAARGGGDNQSQENEGGDGAGNDLNRQNGGTR